MLSGLITPHELCTPKSLHGQEHQAINEKPEGQEDKEPWKWQGRTTVLLLNAEER